MLNQNYHPGVCNIGKDEVNKRKRSFALWMLLLIASTVYLMLSDFNLIFSLIIEFIVACFVAVMLLQITNQFCVFFGLIGKYNFHKVGFGDKVTQPDFLIADRRKAFMILVQAILIASVFIAVFYFIKRIYFYE